MRSLVIMVLVAALARVGVADEGSAVVEQRTIPSTSAEVPRLSRAEADALARSGRRRIGAGIALIAVGALGWLASTAGTAVAIAYYVKDWRNQCGGGACDGLHATGLWLGVGGGIAEVGGLAGGIPLLVSGIRRVDDARTLVHVGARF